MAEAPAGDDILTESDAVNILEELTEAQNHSHILGLMLRINPVQIEAIYKMYQDPKERLCQIILAFLRQAEPPPTWRAIVNALKSNTVNLIALAKRVEAAHFPDPTASRDPPTTSVVSFVPPYERLSTKSEFSKDVRQQPSATYIQSSLSGDASVLQLATSSGEVKIMIDTSKKQFISLRNNIRECLERQKVLVSSVADVLTSLSPDDEVRHKMFVMCHVKGLYEASSIFELFGVMNCHWNYLDPSLLELLVKEFDLVEIKDQIEAYKSELMQFRMRTPLALFCQTQKRRRQRPDEDFKKMVVEFDWPENVTLEDVEQFRQEYNSEYGLHECAMMLVQIMTG